MCTQTSFAMRKTLNLGSRCSSLVTKNLRRFSKAGGKGGRGGKIGEGGQKREIEKQRNREGER